MYKKWVFIIWHNKKRSGHWWKILILASIGLFWSQQSNFENFAIWATCGRRGKKRAVELNLFARFSRTSWYTTAHWVVIGRNWRKPLIGRPPKKLRVCSHVSGGGPLSDSDCGSYSQGWRYSILVLEQIPLHDSRIGSLKLRSGSSRESDPSKESDHFEESHPFQESDL